METKTMDQKDSGDIVNEASTQVLLEAVAL
jgi:hypothetical protein